MDLEAMVILECNNENFGGSREIRNLGVNLEDGVIKIT
jgi:hypothetical protein